MAAEHGAIGCIIYSDPADDGYVQGDVYPVGPFRPKDGVQRGSVMDMPVYPGDPLTPNVGATAAAVVTVTATCPSEVSVGACTFNWPSLIK